MTLAAPADIAADLQRRIGRPADLEQLFQAMRRLYHECRTRGLGLRFSINPTRAYRASLIESIELDGDDTARPRVKVALNCVGLFGRMGFLPDYFTDMIIGKRQDPDGLRAFLNLFNHRLLELLFVAWRNHEIFLGNLFRDDDQRARDFDHFLRGLGGLADDRDDDAGSRCFRRHFLAMFQSSARSTSGLVFLLSAYFPDHRFEVREHEARWLDIPEDQRARLGSGLQLGRRGSFLIGSKIRDINGKIGVTIADLTYTDYLAFLPGEEKFEQLKKLFFDYTDGMWSAALTLELRAEETPDMCLNGSRMLGRNCWLVSGSPPAAPHARFADAL